MNSYRLAPAPVGVGRRMSYNVLSFYEQEVRGRLPAVALWAVRQASWPPRAGKWGVRRGCASLPPPSRRSCYKVSGACIMARRLLRLKPGFDTALARKGYSVRGFARFSGVPHQTLFALLHPQHQAKERALGGMHLRTAWRIAQAYATLAGMSEDEAYAELIAEEHPAPASVVD